MMLCIPFFLLRGNVEEMGVPRGPNLNLGLLDHWARAAELADSKDGCSGINSADRLLVVAA